MGEAHTRLRRPAVSSCSADASAPMAGVPPGREGDPSNERGWRALGSATPAPPC